MRRDDTITVLRGWANQMAARYGHPVYLVGSSLDVDDVNEARDFDVRIVLPDAEFETRFGVEVADWYRQQWSTWGDGSRRWGAEMAKLARGFTTTFAKLKLNIDLQVHPFYLARTFFDRPSVRLDDLDIEKNIDMSNELPATLSI